LVRQQLLSGLLSAAWKLKVNCCTLKMARSWNALAHLC
jgi:hypothetical protein